MKTNHALSIVAGILLASAVSSAQAGEYQFRHYLSGLKQASTSVPEEPEQDENWTLSSATLPRAVTNQAYSYSFYDLVTPNGLTGFQWAGSGLPAWASLNAITGELTGTPSASDAGSSSFGVYAIQGGKNGQQVYTIEVAGVTLEVLQISAGYYHTCAVTTDGAALCWGHNGTGKLGNNTTAGSITPVQVQGLSSGVASISAGADHTCAVTTSGAAKCWGSNTKGHLGNGTYNNSLVPVAVSGLSTGVTSIVAGYSHSCALTKSGAVKCWGNGSANQLGNGGSSIATTPVSVSGLASGVTNISTLGSSTCALTTAGAVKCWGDNSYGQLGSGDTSSSTVPVSISSLNSGIESVAVGSQHACAITTSGVAKCWGRGSSGQLGNGSTTDSYIPVTISQLGSGVKRMSGGSNFTCAILANGSAKCFGYNAYSQLGNDLTENSSIPVSVISLTGDVIDISTGANHSCALLSNGTAKCWGFNSDGRLGDGSTTNRGIPTEVNSPN